MATVTEPSATLDVGHPAQGGPTTARADRRGAVGHFVRHLAEMTLAMMLGMAVLGAAVRAALTAAGVDYHEAALRLPAVFALIMSVNMTVPMVLWMRHRGHSRRYSAEMAAAMFVPVLVLIPLFWLGIISDDALTGIQHVAMLPSMVVVMLHRRNEVIG